MIIILQIHVFNIIDFPTWPSPTQIQILWPVANLANSSVYWSWLSIMSRACGPLEVRITSPACNVLVTCIRAFYGISACFLWPQDHKMPYAYSKGFHMVYVRAWEYDYVCGHRAGPCWCHERVWEYPYNQSYRAVQGPMKPLKAPSCYIYQVKPEYVPFDQ